MAAVHDITINGSLYGQGCGLYDAERNAAIISCENPTRIVRVHATDGIDVVSSWRNGRREP